jgi:hypothetical protein
MIAAAVAAAMTAVETTTVSEATTTAEATTAAVGASTATIAAVEAWELATKAGGGGMIAVLTVREIQLGAKTGVLVERWIRSDKAIAR